jgi:hypothetical protein
MLNKKLMEVLSRLSKAEHKRLRLFIQSPYFNTGLNEEILLSLYDYLAKYRFEEEAAELQKEVVSALFFPDKVFKMKEKGPLDMLCSDLFKMVRRFLEQISTEKGTETSELLALSKFYDKYGLEDRFKASIDQVRKNLEKETIRESDYFHTQFVLEDQVAHFQTLNNSYEGDANLMAAHESIDLYYLIIKLQFLCGLSFQRKLSSSIEQGDSVTNKFVREVIDQYHEHGIPVIRLHNYVLKLIHDENNADVFNKFEYEIEEYKSSISEATLKNLMAYYRYFWVRRYLKASDPSTSGRLFEIYQKHFEAGYFFIGDNISISALRSLLLFALKTKKFDWIKGVLDSVPPSRIIGTRYPNEVHSLNYAEYYFEVNQYDLAHGLLIYKNFENPLFGMMADLLIIKMYYETNEDLLDSRMKALDMKVRRSKLSSDFKERYLNFLKKLYKILKIRHVGSKEARSKLLTEIKMDPNVVSKEWLLSKLEPSKPE